MPKCDFITHQFQIVEPFLDGDLQVYEARDHYFIRVAQWRWLSKEMICVVDPHGPRILTLDPWPQLVFLAASGTQTVSEYIYEMASKYTGASKTALSCRAIMESN
jgi:hypothetical protein